jgi:hypothetical protein
VLGINNYLVRMNVRRETPPIAFVDDDLSVITYRNNKHAKLTQVGLVARKYGYQKKLQNERERYYANKEKRLQQIKQYRAKNPEKVKEWRDKNNKRNKGYQSEWRKKNTKKCAQYTYKYRNKKLAAMTPEQQKEYKKQQYQKNRERMIEKHGLEGWRKICNERTKISREKKRDKNSKS